MARQFTTDATRRIARQTRFSETRKITQVPYKRRESDTPKTGLIAKTNEIIPAMASTVPGTGEATVYTLKSDDSLYIQGDGYGNNRVETIYNSRGPIASGEWVQCIRIRDKWWVEYPETGTVAYKEWGITFDHGHEITGYEGHPASVSDVLASGDVGVSWDEGAKNWLVERAGVFIVILDVRFDADKLNRVEIEGEAPTGTWTHIDPPPGLQTNIKRERISKITLLTADGYGKQETYYRNNFATYEHNSTWRSQLRADSTCSMEADERIRAKVEALIYYDGAKIAEADVVGEEIILGRLHVFRMAETPATEAMPGPVTYYRVDEDELNQRVSEDILGNDDRIVE